MRAGLAAEGIEDVVARRADERARLAGAPFDRGKYRGRNVAERPAGWLRERRRLATRYDKLAVNFAAMLRLACILWYL